MIKSRAMEISLNGELRQFPSPLTVAALVETLGYAGKRIAVERNGEMFRAAVTLTLRWRTVTRSKSSSPLAVAELPRASFDARLTV